MRRVLWTLSLLVDVVACSSKQNDTKIVVEVWSDLAVPSQMDDIRIEAKGTTASPPADFPLTDKTSLPVVLVLVPPDNQGLAFDVAATGYLKSNPVVSQAAHLSFVTGKSLVLTLFLGSACKGTPCSANETCSSGNCETVNVDSNSLPAYDPTAPFPRPDAGSSPGLDGGADAGAYPGGAEVGGVDATVDGRETGDSAVDKFLAGLDLGSDVAADAANPPYTPTDAPSDLAAPPDLRPPVDLAPPADVSQDLAEPTSPAPDAPPLDVFGSDTPARDASVDSAGSSCQFACCKDGDCSGACQTCGASHTCVAAVNQDDPNGRCAGTCDSTGACRSKKGQACTTVATGCATGTLCVDGYCCDRACSGSCEACDVPGSLGTCTTLANGSSPHLGHTPCAGTDPLCAGICNGVSASCFYSTSPCGTASCTGSTYQPAGACDTETCSIPLPQPCLDGQTCSGNACACLAPMTMCTGSCINPQNELGNCGGCGQACSSAHGTPGCTSGSCAMSACTTDYLDCSANENISRDGCETHVVDDLNNCGQCGKVCPNDWPNSTPKCSTGACGHQCTAPWDNCDGVAGNGCEANLNTDGANCGHCGGACSSTVCRNQTCLTTARYGNTGAGTSNVNFAGNYLAGIQVYIPNASVVTGLGVVLYGSTVSRDMYLGLYKDLAGNPSGLVATTTSTLVAPGGKEMSVVPVPVDIAAGNYWILGVWDGTASFATNTATTVTWRYASYAFGALPTTAPTGMSSTSVAPPNLYAIVAQ